MNFSTAETAYMDQCLAAVGEKLDMLVVSYGAAVGCPLNGLPVEVAVPFMAQAVKQMTGHESCTEMLAMAIHRLWVAGGSGWEGLG